MSVDFVGNILNQARDLGQLSTSFDSHARSNDIEATTNNLGSIDSVLQQAVRQSYETMVRFGQRDDFAAQMAVAFGEGFDRVAAEQFFDSLGMGAGVLPRVEVLEDSVLGGAFGAYAQATDTVYLSQQFLASGNVDAITGVLLEEFGHGIDTRVNAIDAAGDEGDIFSLIVRGEAISEEVLIALLAEDDTGYTFINGHNLKLEFRTGQSNTDINGDGKDDAIVVNDAGVTIRRSNGSSFGPNENWTTNPYYGSRGTYFADVTGDGRADAVVVNDAGVTIRRSNGSSFGPNENWTTNPYYGSRGTYFADVTGDGRADAVVVNDAGVTIRRSNGSSFGPNENWTTNLYYGSRGTYFADVTGDGRADAVVVNDAGVTIRRSNGSSFGPNENWTTNPYYGSRGTYFADVTGDGRADAVVVNDAGVTIRRSNGSSFGPNENWTTNPYYGGRGTYFADVTGDGRADAVVVNDAGVTIRRSNGSSFGPNENWTTNPYYGSRGTFFGSSFSDLAGGGFSPLLTRQDASYFQSRRQFYGKEGNPFAASGLGSSLLGENSSGMEGNCTWYVYGRLKELGYRPEDAVASLGQANAKQWSAFQNGASIATQPQSGDIAQWTTGEFGHVAIVEKVEGDYIWISESNWSIDKDGDQDGDGKTNGDGTLHHIVKYHKSAVNRFIRLRK